MRDESGLRGNLHAIEYLLGQLFVLGIENIDDPQRYLLLNAQDIKAKIFRENSLSPEDRKCAYGTVRRVMETASMHFDTAGRGPQIDLRSEQSHQD